MLECENLCLEFPGKVLCRDLKLTVKPGECWGILGKNGSGKTTLIHALGGLISPVRGSVALENRGLGAYPKRELARKLGVLLQEEATGFWGSVKEYALLGRHPHSKNIFGWQPRDHELALAALRRMELGDLEQRSLETLSGGERQRARIALLLTQQPQVYLLDEPLQHLDVRHQFQAVRIFRELALNGENAVMMVLHDTLWASRYCDHLLLLYGDGKARAGPAAELLSRGNLEELYQCALEEFGAGPSRHYLPRDAGANAPRV